MSHCKILCFIILAINVITRSTMSSSIFLLIGGTGDLSSKHLWDAVFRRVYSTNSLSAYTKIYTSGRSDDIEGKAKLEKIMKHLHCLPNEDQNLCQTNIKRFTSGLEYRKLENDADYGRFCADLFLGKENLENLTEISWYLATPPSYYPVILMSIYTHCLNSTAKTKVAFEKPFWKDQQEYIALSHIISARFKPNQLYFIDHYLAKDTFKALAEFKRLNRAWFKMRRVDKIELLHLERDSISQGRLTFFDSYGVIRDVMMSHMNHILLMLLSHNDENLFSVDWDKDDELDSLRDILGRLRPIARSDWILGQHLNYKNLTKYQSKTPTFASIKFKFDITPDSGDTVEKDVALVAGKYMDAKRSYARIIFKNADGSPEDEIIFLFTAPLILANLNAENSALKTPEGWIKDETESLCEKWINRLFTPTPCSKFIALKPASISTKNPYEIILDAFLAPSRQKLPIFTKFSILEESWKTVWSHVIKDLDAENRQFRTVTYERANQVLNLIFTNDSTIKQRTEL